MAMHEQRHSRVLQLPSVTEVVTDDLDQLLENPHVAHFWMTAFADEVVDMRRPVLAITVDATIALARRVRERQPRLWAHALKLRDKRVAAGYLDIVKMTPVLHVSSKILASRRCIARRTQVDDGS